jgi:hypothetical protein
MTDVLVERSYPEPLTDEIMGANLARTMGCLQLHHVQWQRSYLSADRRELVCHFTARDAESVRIAFRQAGSPDALIWSGTVHDTPDITETDLAEAGIFACCTALAPGRFEAQLAGERPDPACMAIHRVMAVRSYVSNDRRRMIGLYRSRDAESVRMVLHGGGRSIERVWPCRHLAP